MVEPWQGPASYCETRKSVLASVRRVGGGIELALAILAFVLPACTDIWTYPAVRAAFVGGVRVVGAWQTIRRRVDGCTSTCTI